MKGLLGWMLVIAVSLVLFFAFGGLHNRVAIIVLVVALGLGLIIGLQRKPKA